MCCCRLSCNITLGDIVHFSGGVLCVDGDLAEVIFADKASLSETDRPPRFPKSGTPELWSQSVLCVEDGLRCPSATAPPPHNYFIVRGAESWSGANADGYNLMTDCACIYNARGNRVFLSFTSPWMKYPVVRLSLSSSSSSSPSSFGLNLATHVRKKRDSPTTSAGSVEPPGPLCVPVTRPRRWVRDTLDVF